MHSSLTSLLMNWDETAQGTDPAQERYTAEEAGKFISVAVSAQTG